MATIATHNGSTAHRDHNIRNEKVVSKEKHIDPNGRYEIWKDEKPREAYHKLFDKAEQRLKSLQSEINESESIKAMLDNEIENRERHIGQRQIKHQVH